MAESKKSKPRILIITGEGKGKTTAAFGMALRALGHKMRVGIIQFIKADTNSGELLALKKFNNVTIKTMGCGFVFEKAGEKYELHLEAAEGAFEAAKQMLLNPEMDMVVLDEVLTAVELALIKEVALKKIIEAATVENAPNKIIIMTGRDAAGSLIDMADTVSEIQSIKHGFEVGIKAQRGVEH